MLFTAGFILLFVWLIGLLGIFRVGDLLHVFLLLGLLILLLGILKARDQDAGPGIGSRADKR